MGQMPSSVSSLSYLHRSVFVSFILVVPAISGALRRLSGSFSVCFSAALSFPYPPLVFLRSSVMLRCRRTSFAVFCTSPPVFPPAALPSLPAFLPFPSGTLVFCRLCPCFRRLRPSLSAVFKGYLLLHRPFSLRLPLYFPCSGAALSGSQRTSSTVSSVKRPSLPPRNSSNNMRLMRSVSTCAPRIRKPRFRPAFSNRS